MSFLKNNPELKEKVDALKAKYGDNNVFAYKAKDGKVAFLKDRTELQLMHLHL